MRHRSLLIGLLLGVLVLSVPVSAQGPFAAQIQRALRAFLTQAHTWTAVQTFSGGCVGCGGGVASVTAGTGTITIGGTAADPTVAVNLGSANTWSAALSNSAQFLGAADNCTTLSFSFTGRTTTGLCTAAASNWRLVGGGTTGIQGNSTDVSANLTVRPITDNVIDLGTAAIRWRSIYTSADQFNAGDYRGDNGFSRLNLNTDGAANFADAAGTSWSHLRFGPGTTAGWRMNFAGDTISLREGDDSASIGIGVASATFSGGSVLDGATSNTVEQYNGTNAQSLYLYTTRTDASNYERLAILTSPVAGRMYLQPEKAGTGGNRELWIRNTTSNIQIDAVNGGNITLSDNAVANWDVPGSTGDLRRQGGRAVYKQGAPSVGGSCGTGPALATNSADSAGKVTTGTGAPTSCTVTFSAAFSNAPACQVTNETTANLARATSTTTTVVLAGTLVAGDVLSYTCVGY